MKVINYGEVKSIIAMKDIYAMQISFLDYPMFSLLNKFKDQDTSELVSILNSINNQGIEELILPTGYVFRGETFSVECLSTAEKVFLVTYLAIKSNTRIFILSDLRGLEYNTLKLFVKTFKEMDANDCIYLVGLGNSDVNLIESALEGESLC